MRLGGPLFAKIESPEAWIRAVRQEGYRAAYCPLPPGAPEDRVRAYRRAAEAADIVIAEVGAWCNPLSPDPEIRRKALEHCRAGLDLADRIGARCCVNIAGSRGEKWDGPDPRDLEADTFDLIVETVRGILDAVRPRRTFYTLETMPWMFPHSADSYLRLLDAVDRPRFGVHLDPVNLVNSPERCFHNGALIRECIEKLGPRIRSCHAKDIRLAPRLTVHLDEVRPGLGCLDYRVFLDALGRLDPETPLMLEHLAGAEEYRAAAGYIRGVAAESGISL